jgi:hypothetical protein
VEEGVSDRPFISAVERDEARCRLGLISCGGRGSFLFRSFRGVEYGESLPAEIVEVEEDPKVMIDPSVDEVGGYEGRWFSDIDEAPLGRCRQLPRGHPQLIALSVEVDDT